MAALSTACVEWQSLHGAVNWARQSSDSSSRPVAITHMTGLAPRAIQHSLWEKGLFLDCDQHTAHDLLGKLVCRRRAVHQPGRARRHNGCGTELAVTKFRSSYRRAAVIQALLPVLTRLFSVFAWLTGGNAWCLMGGLVLRSVVPLTLISIMPTNKALLDASLDKQSPKAQHSSGHGRGYTLYEPA